MFDVQSVTNAPADETFSPSVAQPVTKAPAAPAKRVPLPFRKDTILGVCEGLGEDLGIHPNWFRVALAVGLMWSPVVIVSIYLGLGVIVAASRWFFPRVDAAVVVEEDTQAPPFQAAA